MNNDNGTMIRLLLVEDDANLCYIIRGGLEDMSSPEIALQQKR